MNFGWRIHDCLVCHAEKLLKKRIAPWVWIEGVKADEHYQFDPIEGGIRVTYTMDYNVPVPVLGGLLNVLYFRSS